MVNDILSDTIIRIKNGLNSERESVLVSRSKTSLALAKIFKKQGVISKIRKRERELVLNLLKNPYTIFKRVSRPGQRIYRSYRSIKPLNYGFRVVSTPQGFMVEKDAVKNKLGGEIICEVK